MSRTVFSGVGDDVVLYREFLRRKGSTLDIAGDKLLALFIVTPIYWAISSIVCLDAISSCLSGVSIP